MAARESESGIHRTVVGIEREQGGLARRRDGDRCADREAAAALLVAPLRSPIRASRHLLRDFFSFMVLLRKGRATPAGRTAQRRFFVSLPRDSPVGLK